MAATLIAGGLSLGSASGKVYAADGDVPIDAAHFEDDHFRSRLLDIDQDDYDGDGMLSQTEIASLKYLYVGWCDISSLKGIEYLTELESLEVEENSLTELDVSKNTKLKYLDFSDNQIQTIDLKSNPDLETLRCNNNQLTELSLGQNLKLKL